MSRRSLWCAGVVVLAALVLVGCGGSTVVNVQQSGGAVGPQEIEGATQVIRFDPASISLDGRAPVPGDCEASTAVPGSYACRLAGEAAEPCFPLGDDRLLCAPNPVAGTYGALVSAGSALPQVPPPAPGSTEAFFVELAGDVESCWLRTAIEPVIIGGVTALYDCDAPYTYGLGFDKDAPAWLMALYTLDPDTGSSPSGKVPTRVLRAWIP